MLNLAVDNQNAVEDQDLQAAREVRHGIVG